MKILKKGKLYKNLDIAVNAAKSEIKRAYRKLAKLHHPDKGGDEEMFKKIQKAYDVLKDDEKRAHYDRTGDTNTINNGPEKTLMAIFNAIIESGDFHGNLIDRIVEKLSDEISAMQKNMHQIKSELVKLIHLTDRISIDGANLFELVLQGSIDQLKASLASKDERILEMMDMKERLSSYSDDKPDFSKREPSINDLLGGLGRGPLDDFRRYGP